MRIVSFILFFFVAIISYSQYNIPTYTVAIPMGDGKFLAADVYIPNTCTQCPTILIQTPYGKWWYNYTANYFGGLPFVDSSFATGNYAFVVVDWRGFYGSALAAYSGSPTTGEDGYDCVEWVAQQSWSNGKVGTWGPSALGRAQYLTAKENPPHLICMVPLVAGPQYNYLEYFPGGVYRTEYVEQLDGLNFGMSAKLLPHPVYDLFWQSLELQNFYPASINIPALMVGGWYDHNTEVIHTFFNALRSNSPLGVRDKHRLLMGPWVHGGYSIAQVGTALQGELSYPNAAGWSDSLALLFFDYHLRNVGNGWDQTPYVQYYQMGENNWKSSAVWPPTGLADYNFYFHTDSTMDINIPTNSTGSLNFNYDPLDPSPTVGGSTLNASLGMVQGPYDQAPLVENRSDILTFTTPPLTQDVIMTGNAEVHLKVSSDKTDTDFAVRLTDVYPDGRSMIVMDGIRRMRFRNGYTAAAVALMTPGQTYSCVIDLPATAITFTAGHRIRVDITSSNYPRFNRNANSGGTMYPGLNGDSLQNPQIAINTVYMNNTNNSYIKLPLASAPTYIISEGKTTLDLSIFPNPVADEIKMMLYLNNSDHVQVDLVDITGKEIKRLFTQYIPKGSHILNFPAAEVSQGMYFLQLKTLSGGSMVKKVIIQ